MSSPSKVVAEQAEDEGLWFVPQTAPEDYLQQALRRLHAAVEKADGTHQPCTNCDDSGFVEHSLGFARCACCGVVVYGTRSVSEVRE